MMNTHKTLLTLCLFSLFASTGSYAGNTIVRFDTTLGDIDVELFDTATPLSVTNFLTYVTSDRYDGTFLHRSEADFVVQGGGFSLTPDIFNISIVPQDPPVLNEPGISNVRATIAYAKLPGDPDSATSQWFFNLVDNSANLDVQNGGFTVFGQVINNTMAVVDAIAGLDVVNAGGGFTSVPVLDLTQVLNQQNIFNSDAVLINDIYVIPEFIPEPASVVLVCLGAVLGLHSTNRRR